MKPGDTFVLTRHFQLNRKLYNPGSLVPGTTIKIVAIRPGPNPKGDFTGFVSHFYTAVEFTPLDGPYLDKHFIGGKSSPCPFDH